MPQVFDCRDFVLDPLPERIAVALQARGLEVVRGPEAEARGRQSGALEDVKLN
jgi:hypothetical protein